MNKEPNSKLHKTLTIIGIVLCVILVPMLIVNCTLIIKSFVNEDEVPNFGGLMPLIVLSDSMYPDIKSGDIIFCTTIDADEVKVDDVISFFDPEGGGSSAVITHKVREKYEENGITFFKTYGINNNTDDVIPVPETKLVGRYVDFRLPGAGHVALFMQTTAGFIVCVFLPLVLLVGYDIIRRRMYDKTKGEDMDALKRELEALKAAQKKDGETPAESAEETVETEALNATEDPSNG